ncbi:MAG: hypothetical protein ABIK44_01930 [candidate division WOR-3 bacterium]
MSYGDSLVHFIYYSSLSQPELVTPAGEGRSRWYGVSLWPTAFFSGRRQEQITSPDSFYAAYQAEFLGARSRTTVLAMALDSATTLIDSQRVSIGVRVHPTDTVANRLTGVNLVGIVFEDSVPYYSPLRGETVYASVAVRQVIGDTWGVPIRLSFGADLDTVLTTPTGSWRFDKVGVAAFVQDTTTKEVLQAVMKRRIME